MSGIEDTDTVAYFDNHVPEYSVGRLAHPAAFISENGGASASVVDIGCGAGNTLAYMGDATGATELCGIDVSANLLERTHEEVPGCETHLGSILDTELLDAIGRERFDFAVIAAVLHHLIGRTRRESHRRAELAVTNALELLKPGGHLIVVDEGFSPPRAVDAVFYVKKAVTRLTSRRVGILGEWNNIGPPVVSYYTNEQLVEMVQARGAAELVNQVREPAHLGRGVNILLSKTDITLISRKRVLR